MDELLRAIVLGIVQGLTEFLPVSSSGHLILVPRLFNWDDQGLAFDVGLHLGTLVALLVYFWRDWYRMARSFLGDLGSSGINVRTYAPDSRLLLYIAAGSVPAAIVGLLFADWIEEHVRQAWLVAITLAAVGVIMLVADRRSRRERAIGSITLRDALLIGVAQACALIPGVSRSGATMSTALFLDFTRDDAARFAFLLGTPAFVGAAILKFSDLTGDDVEADMLVIGFLTSAIVGFAAIHGLLRYLRTRDFVPFVAYRFAVAALTLIIAGIRVA
ncbi:MAG TPA: undecaprenyl-diphosphatase UppP [Tepidiformaceae bacterium]|nr:undecaprenyl-diphosphatase UppP [Tepidiformaceae bacterium]